MFLDRNLIRLGFPNVKTFPAFRLSGLPSQDMLQVEKLLPPSLTPRTTFQGGNQHCLCRQSRRVGPARALVEFDLASQLGGSC